MPGGGWGQALPAQGPASTFLPIASSPGRAGQDWVDFGLAEPHTVLFHEPGSSSVWVGGRGKVYLFDFPEGKNASVRTVSLDPSAWIPLWAPGSELSPSLPPPPISLLVSPLALVRGLRESMGVSPLPKPSTLYYIPYMAWERLPKGSPDWRGYWGGVEKGLELAPQAKWLVLLRETWTGSWAPEPHGPCLQRFLALGFGSGYQAKQSV